jgi:hypothetical protein
MVQVVVNKYVTSTHNLTFYSIKVNFILVLVTNIVCNPETKLEQMPLFLYQIGTKETMLHTVAWYSSYNYIYYKFVHIIGIPNFEIIVNAKRMLKKISY